MVVYLTRDERIFLQDRSKELGYTMSDYLRYLIDRDIDRHTAVTWTRKGDF